MPESKIISTSTIINSTVSKISIYTFYDRTEASCEGNDFFTDYPSILEVILSEVNGKFKNYIGYKECELVITNKENPSIVINISNLGELIMEAEDVASYFINEYGELIYDFCHCPDSDYVKCNYVDEDYVESEE